MSNQTSTQERPPIVVVMGHVDHGKSTLLDYIRKTNVVAKEAGGITQHVAAYEVLHEHEGTTKRITFIDTPGHAAFQAIRARGANIADIAILVVAADDGVKAQTLEALSAIRESGIPFVVAINKIDKPNADLARTQGSLLEQHVYLERLGGDVPWAAISAKVGTGVDELLDLVLIVAEMRELRADTSQCAGGYVIEAHRDPKRGIAATLIITNGELKTGMAITAGHAVAPVRIMENHLGKPLKSATFSTPITIVGFDELPEVGTTFTSCGSKKEAEAARVVPLQTARALTTIEEGRFMLPVIVRADTVGSLDAIVHEVQKLGDEHMGIRIVHSGIGTVSEADIKAAIASAETPAIVIGFDVAVDNTARDYARQFSITIETFDIIYKLTERLTELMKSTAPKRSVEEPLGRAHIVKAYSRRRDTHLIGARVLSGTIFKNASMRIVRKKVEVGVGTMGNIQTNKQNVDRVGEDGEFGAEVEADFDIQEGDVIECFKMITV